MFKNYCNVKIIFILLFVCAIQTLNIQKLEGNTIGEIFCKEYPADKKIYFGPYLTDDRGTMNFVVRSFMPNDTFIIRNMSPTFIIQTYHNSATAVDPQNFDRNMNP
jgi:hypothetical protein